MDAGTVVLVINILLLVAGWLLFQEARRDLNARAAEAPVLEEIKTLQKSVAALLEQLKLESTQTSAQLETRCLHARELLAALDKRLGSDQTPGIVAREATAQPFEEIQSLAASGMPAEEIAQRTGRTVGEVELILGLRRQVS